MFSVRQNYSLPTPAAQRRSCDEKMDLHELQSQLILWLDEASYLFQKIPGSAVLIRYVRSSYQNDPVRSAIELVLVIFFIRYLLSPSYSTSKQNFIKLREDVRSIPRGETLLDFLHWHNLVSLMRHSRMRCRKSMNWSTNGFLNPWLRVERPWRNWRLRDFLSSPGKHPFCKQPLRKSPFERRGRVLPSISTRQD